MVTVGSLNVLADCIREAATGQVRRRRGVRRAVRRDTSPIASPVVPTATKEEEDTRVAA
jgi:hypothetical protein